MFYLEVLVDKNVVKNLNNLNKYIQFTHETLINNKCNFLDLAAVNVVNK